MNSQSNPKMLLVRHGRTKFNAEGRVQGGGQLDDVGWGQVQALVKRLEGTEINAIYSSPTTRTLQTARAIARDRPMYVRKRWSLRDIDYGIYSGQRLVEAKIYDPNLWQMWRDAPHTVTFPQGESLLALRNRVKQFLDEMKRYRGDRTIVVATHDSPIRVICCIAEGLDDSHHHKHVTTEASVTTFALTELGPRLLIHNDVSHLQGTYEK